MHAGDCGHQLPSPGFLGFEGAPVEDLWIVPAAHRDDLVLPLLRRHASPSYGCPHTPWPAMRKRGERFSPRPVGGYLRHRPPLLGRGDVGVETEGNPHRGMPEPL